MDPRLAAFYQKRIRAVYQKHNPTKLSELDGLFEKYHDMEPELYQRICLKYRVPQDPVPASFDTEASENIIKKEDYEQLKLAHQN